MVVFFVEAFWWWFFLVVKGMAMQSSMLTVGGAEFTDEAVAEAKGVPALMADHSGSAPSPWRKSSQVS